MSSLNKPLMSSKLELTALQLFIAGYYVLAFNPNDENAREYVVENGMEVLHNKNCFATIIDANGLCSISSK